jgi:hybrid polyketide synthase/nonribosomal peptide synthetase ACE1
VRNVLASAEDIENSWNTLNRTGDLGRWRQDGTLLIEGRISGDTQVMIRGCRIDLCEVEYAMIEAADGALLEAVVSKRDSMALRPEILVAHIVYNKTDRAVEECIAGLEARLSSRLPAYMCPAVIIPLEEMTMTSSGKLDRRAAATLPIPESE